MVAGTVGFQLTLDPQVGVSGNISTLTGTAVTLVTVYPDERTRVTRAATVAGNGATASYITVAGDFPVAGIYQLQLSVVGGGGAPFLSTTYSLAVTAAL